MTISTPPIWDDGAPMHLGRPGFWGWLRVLRRGVPAILFLGVNVPLVIMLRLMEWPFVGPRRPLSGPWVQIICRLVLRVMGIGWSCEGRVMRGPGAVVANHSSWLDIFALNAAMPVFFVAKSEVSTWPGVNILTRVTQTHFVRRDPKLAQSQAVEFAQRVQAGHRLLFFPEGTSSDGLRVLPFKPTLFQGFLHQGLPANLSLQPVTVTYTAPIGQDPRFYAWWGDMALGPHLVAVLAQRRQGRVQVIFHDPVFVAGQNRKTLAAQCERAVRSRLMTGSHLIEHK